MLLYEILTEGLPQGGTLYHGSDVMSAARILLANEIKPATDHMIWQSNGAVRSPPGVSLTRSFRFAVDWKGGAGVVFALDGSALRAKSKLITTDYYQDRREAEEFLVGAIKPLSAFLTAIFISEETRDYCIEHDENLVEGHKDYEDLLAHPLLKVQKFPKQVPYSNPRKPGAKMFDASPG